jgi:hypothetical protein
MAQTKTYLTVPYAQKDEAKALGARWDASQKKWYVPADKDIALFGKWPVISSDMLAAPTNQAPSKNTASQPPDTASPVKQGFTTYPSIDNFSAYNGDEPPWA